MSKQESYDFFYTAIERDVYSCKKCKIKAKYSMQKFNKEYREEFDKRFEEIWSWHMRNPNSNIIRLGDVSRLRDVVIGKKVKYDYWVNSYKFKESKKNDIMSLRD